MVPLSLNEKTFLENIDFIVTEMFLKKIQI